jgi:hypothetical protein
MKRWRLPISLILSLAVPVRRLREVMGMVVKLKSRVMARPKPRAA